jgi:homoserine kinase
MAAALTDEGIDEPSVVREAMKYSPTHLSIELIYAFFAHVADRSLLPSPATRDKVHQPFRMHLVPGLHECLALSSHNTPGVLGVCLSGSGASCLPCRSRHAPSWMIG